MPEIVFDYAAIRSNLHGDDWYKPQRDMVETARNAQQREDCCEQACDPIPCTAPTPPGQPAQGGVPLRQGLLSRNPTPEIGQQLRLRNVPPEIERLHEENLRLVDSAVQQLQQNPALISDCPQSRAVHMLVSTIEQNICEETHKLHERIARMRSMVWRGGPREENERIKEEEARYQLVTAPMRRQRDWLLQQIIEFTAPPKVMVAPYDGINESCKLDYACEPVREVDLRTHKRR